LGSRVARGENLRCKVKVKNFQKTLVNATAITLTITDPDETAVKNVTLIEITHEDLGLYYYDYTPDIAAVTGTYTALWDVTYSGLHRKSRGYFIVTK
jgi:uncharacterized protein YfaS (alpha-2-macroglobulin family)